MRIFAGKMCFEENSFRGLCYFEISEQFTIENFLMIIFYDKTNVIIYIPFKMDFSFTSENTILSYNE